MHILMEGEGEQIVTCIVILYMSNPCGYHMTCEWEMCLCPCIVHVEFIQCHGCKAYLHVKIYWCLSSYFYRYLQFSPAYYSDCEVDFVSCSLSEDGKAFAIREDQILGNQQSNMDETKEIEIVG